MIAGFVRDCSLDIENLESVECQTTVMPLRICQTGNGIEDGLFDILARTDSNYRMLMLVMFHEFLPESLRSATPRPDALVVRVKTSFEMYQACTRGATVRSHGSQPVAGAAHPAQCRIP